MNKFLVIDPFIHLSEHTLVDRSLIEFFSQYDSIVVVNETMKNECKDLPCHFLHCFFDFKSKSKFFRLINREIIKTLYTLFLLIRYSFQRRRIVFLALSQFQWLFFSIICTLFRFKTSIVMHHYAEALIKEKPELSFGDKMFLFGKRLFSRSSCNKFMYLSKHIRHSFSESQVAISRNDFFINHPIPLGFINRVPFHNPANEKKVLATIGLLSKRMKSSHKINEIILVHNIELKVIGRMAPDDSFIINDNISTYLWDGMYSTKEFESAIDDVDYFIYFFSPQQYKCTASGTLVDAILYSKGVICLNNDAATSLLEFYDRKLIFNNMEELNDYLHLNGGLMEGNNIDVRMKYCLLSNQNADVSIVNRWADIY